MASTALQNLTAGPAAAALLHRLPKVELHLHIAGTLRPDTLTELARSHGLPLPRAAHELYVYRDFYDFIDVLRLAAQAVRSAADFERMAYEAVQDAAKAGARHVEMSFNPQYYMPTNVPYQTQVEGLTAGIAAARRDFDCSALLIAALDRGLPLDSAERAMDEIIGHRHEWVVGVGIDGPEREGPPAKMAALFQRAGRAGFKRTAHVCEDNQTLDEAPPRHVDECLRLLGCDRLDHGYNLLADEDGVQRARDCSVYFCVCGVTSVRRNRERRLASIKAMADAGLPLTLNTDDPAMFHTDPTHTLATVLQGCGWGWKEACALSLAGVDACWLDDDAKRALRQRFLGDIARLEEAAADPAANAAL